MFSRSPKLLHSGARRFNFEISLGDQPICDYASEWYNKALQVQWDALSEGYIVSANYYYDSATDSYVVDCTTVIDGDIWYWDPETDQPYADYSLGKVK